ncbi:hypothetical protein [Nocardiopsis lucentensis]|uniref:hypothetical protein n=1 Tax=Nocardiopsis lucentensis TaxID=53441 RepID=UPI00034C2E14|nr:hypothetical protein [Nocardiopsis lucentensis]
MSDFQLTEAQTGVDGNILRLIDPAEIPTPGGDAEALEQAAADLRSGGEEILELAEGAGSTWSGLEAHYEAPESGELLAAMDPTVEKAEGVESDLTAVADALDDFAAAIRTAKSSLDSLRAQAEELRSEVDADSAIWWLKKPSAITENMDLKDAVNRAWQTYNDAEIECANTISGLSDGPTYVAPDEYTGAPEEIPYGLATDAGEQDRGFTDFAGRYFGDSYEWMREGDDAPWPVDWYLGFQLGALETVVVDVGWETGVTVVSLPGLWGPNTGWTLKPNEIMQNKVEFGQGAVEGTAALVGLHGEDGWLINPFGGEPYWGYDWDAQRDNAGAAWSEQREAFFAWSEWGENNEYAAGVTTTNIALLPVSGTLRAVRTLLGGGRRGGADGPDGGREDVDSDADGFASLDPEGGFDGQFESVDELLGNLDEDPIPDGRVEDLMPDLDTGSDGGPTPRLPTPNPDPDPIPDPTPSPNPRPSVDEPRQDGARSGDPQRPRADEDPRSAGAEPHDVGDDVTPATSRSEASTDDSRHSRETSDRQDGPNSSVNGTGNSNSPIVDVDRISNSGLSRVPGGRMEDRITIDLSGAEIKSEVADFNARSDGTATETAGSKNENESADDAFQADREENFDGDTGQTGDRADQLEGDSNSEPLDNRSDLPFEVSDGVSPDALAEIRGAVDLVSQVHRFPDGMESITFVSEKLEPGKLGQYKPSSRVIIVDVTKPNVRETLVHEIGHAIDHAVHSGRTGSRLATASAMPSTPEMREWSSVVRRSPQFAGLADVTPTHYAKYLRGTQELWARSYAQWIAERTGDARLREELQGHLNLPGPARYRQWSDDDFRPIASAVEAVVRNDWGL